MARGGGETCKLMHRPGGTFSNQVGTTLSGGSNMLLTKDIHTLVVHIDIKGISIDKEDEKVHQHV